MSALEGKTSPFICISTWGWTLRNRSQRRGIKRSFAHDSIYCTASWTFDNAIVIIDFHSPLNHLSIPLVANMKSSCRKDVFLQPGSSKYFQKASIICTGMMIAGDFCEWSRVIFNFPLFFIWLWIKPAWDLRGSPWETAAIGRAYFTFLHLEGIWRSNASFQSELLPLIPTPNKDVLLST